MVDTRLRLQQGRIEVGANPRHAPDNRLEVTTLPPLLQSAARASAWLQGLPFPLRKRSKAALA